LHGERTAGTTGGATGAVAGGSAPPVSAFALAPARPRFFLCGMRSPALFRALFLSAALTAAAGTAAAVAAGSAGGSPSTGTASAPTAASAGLTLAGSDLLRGEVEKTFTAGGCVASRFDGSLPGLKYLRDGRADAALLFLQDKGSVPEIRSGAWLAVPVAFQSVVVAVNALVPVEQINLPTLAGIYSHQQPVNVKNWRDVAPVLKTDLQIIPVAQRTGHDLVAPLFRARALGGKEYRDTVSFYADAGRAAEQVRVNSNVVALLARPPAKGANLRVLAVVSPRTGSAYLPTADNLFNGDYPLSITLYAVVPVKNLARARPLLSLFESDALAEKLDAAGFVNVEKTLKKNLLKVLDR
jgi:ABC-type phosphate transport system substrate-binding protein